MASLSTKPKRPCVPGLKMRALNGKTGLRKRENWVWLPTPRAVEEVCLFLRFTPEEWLRLDQVDLDLCLRKGP